MLMVVSWSVALATLFCSVIDHIWGHLVSLMMCYQGIVCCFGVNRLIGFFIDCLTAVYACVRGEVIVFFGCPSQNVFCCRSIGIPRTLPTSVGFTIFCIFSLFFGFSCFSNRCTRVGYDILHTLVIWPWVTWRDQFKDWFSSLFNELEFLGCSVTSFSGTVLCQDLKSLRNIRFEFVFCLSERTFRKAHLLFALCLQSRIE